MNDPVLKARIEVVAAGPRGEPLRAAIVAELERWAQPGGQLRPHELLKAVERHDKRKGSRRR